MRRAFRARLRILIVGVFVVALFLVLRLYFVQIVHQEDYALKAERQYVSSSARLYDRGAIFFTRKDGTLISAATLGTGFTIAMDPSHVKDPEALYASVSALATVDRTAFEESVAKTDDPYEVLIKQVPEDVGQILSEKKIPGLIIERNRWREYPAGDIASQTIGFVAYDQDVLVGRYGLERYYEQTLSHNADGLFGNFFAELFASLDGVLADGKEAKQGDIITTIEPVVADKLSSILDGVQAQYGSVETAGIIMNPKTGEIIAMEVRPSFDLNNYREADSSRFANPFVEDVREFGSIMKPLTMAAGLDAGVITPETTYNDTGCITVNTRKICNFDGKGRGVVPMQTILANSLNTGVSFITGKLGHDRFRDYFMKLGFGTETGIDLPEETRGLVDNLNSPRDVEYYTASFGQGVAVTPVEMIRALGSLANGGQIVTPHLVKSIRLESGIMKQLSWGSPERVFSKEATEQTTHMLVRVVDESLAHGTVKIPEMSVAAKTGTAQVAGPGGKYYESKYLHSFFGYFPAYDPEFVILLYTREPQGVQYASETLTHPFMELTHFLISYYDIAPDRAVYEDPS
jgi:cell division protein FtsI/penicillin-binding protein 2